MLNAGLSKIASVPAGGGGAASAAPAAPAGGTPAAAAPAESKKGNRYFSLNSSLVFVSVSCFAFDATYLPFLLADEEVDRHK